MPLTTGERRIVSVLVADVAGSTSIAEKLGPERSKFLFDDVVGLMREQVERFDGTVAQLTGDGVLALFGEPAAHENDSERAVRAALGIHDALAAYAKDGAPAYGIELLDGVSASAVDEHTLDVELREPRNDFLHRLGQPPFFAWPRHVYQRDGRDWHRAVPLVGNGPFVLVGSRREPDRPRGLPELARVARERRRGDDRARGLVGSRRESVAKRRVRRPRRAGRRPADPPSRCARDRPRPTGEVAWCGSRRKWRAGPADAPGALAPRRSEVRSGSPPRPAERSRLPRRTEPRRTGARMPRSLGAHAADVAAQLASVGARVRLLVTASDPEGWAAVEPAHAYVWGWGADHPDPGGGVLDPIVSWFPLYRDEQLERLPARAASLRDQPERLRTYREFERIWIGEQAAVVPFAYSDRNLWRRPWVTGLWANAIAMSTFAEAVVARRGSGRLQRS